MTDIDRQIAIAKKKPPTSENLNYIGDLYLKKDDKQQALAYFYEAADKLHFAQKEKKIAIYKKILKISAVSEKAYIGIIEILSKMGLVMEEKKFLHMLAQLYESRGESGKAAALLSKIRELDPHVIPDGTFFHREAHQEVLASAGSSDEPGITEKDTEINRVQIDEKTPADAPVPAMDMQVEKLIEATLEEILPEKSYPAMGPPKTQLRLWYLLGGGMVLFAIAAGLLFYFFAGNRGRSVALTPVNTRINDYEISFSSLDDLTELTGIIDKRDMSNTDFYIFTVRNQIHCVPDAFATFPQDMISLLDKKGGATLSKPVKGLQKTTRTIAKMNVCDKDNAIVFVRTIVAVDRQKQYYGLAISGLQHTGPLLISWD